MADNNVIITFQFQAEGQTGVLSAVDAINAKLKQSQEARQASSFSAADIVPGGPSAPWQPPEIPSSSTTAPVGHEATAEDRHIHVKASAEGHEEIAELGKGAEVASKSFEVLKTGIEGVGQALISGSLQGSITAFTRFGSAVGEAESVVGGFASKFGLIGVVGTAVAATLTTAATVGNELAQRMSENVLEFNELAKAAGLTAQQFANLEGAFRRSGVGLEQLHQVVRVTANRLQGEWGDIVRTVRDSADHYAEGAIKINESQRKAVDSADLPVEAEMKIAKSRREVVDSADKSVEAEMKIAKSRRDVADSSDLTTQAEIRIAKAEREVVDSAVAPKQAERKIESAELGARSAEDAVPGAERTKQQTEFDLTKAQLQFRAKYLGEPITPEENQQLQLLQRQADASHIEALKAQEKEDGRNIERAKMHRDEAEENEQKTHRNAIPEALEGQENAREAAGRAERDAIPEAQEAQQQARLDAARIARDAIPEAREAQEQARIDAAKNERNARPEAEDAQARAAMELRANQRAQEDALRKDPARLAEAIRGGGQGVNWREIAAPDIFRSLAFMGGGTMMGTLSAAHQFVTMPAMQGQTETNQGVAGAVAQQFGLRGGIAQVLDALTKGEFNKITPETQKTAATMGDEGAQKSAEAVRGAWAEASETTRNAVVQAGQQFASLSVSTAKSMAETIQHVADGVSGVTKLTEAATNAADALNAFSGTKMVDGKVVQEGNLFTHLGEAIIGAIRAGLSEGASSSRSMSEQPGIGHADGGYITGPGTGTSDSIRAPWLSNGEYVIPASRVSEVGVGALDAFKDGKIRFAEGGLYDDTSTIDVPHEKRTDEQIRANYRENLDVQLGPITGEAHNKEEARQLGIIPASSEAASEIHSQDFTPDKDKMAGQKHWNNPVAKGENGLLHTTSLKHDFPGYPLLEGTTGQGNGRQWIAKSGEWYEQQGGRPHPRAPAREDRPYRAHDSGLVLSGVSGEIQRETLEEREEARSGSLITPYAKSAGAYKSLPDSLQRGQGWGSASDAEIPSGPDYSRQGGPPSYGVRSGIMGEESVGTTETAGANARVGVTETAGATGNINFASNAGRVPEGWESRVALAPDVKSWWDKSPDHDASAGFPHKPINWASNAGRVPEGWEKRIALAPGIRSWWDKKGGDASARHFPEGPINLASNSSRVPEGWESRIALAPGVKSWWDDARGGGVDQSAASHGIDSHPNVILGSRDSILPQGFDYWSDDRKNHWYAKNNLEAPWFDSAEYGHHNKSLPFSPKEQAQFAKAYKGDEGQNFDPLTWKKAEPVFFEGKWYTGNLPEVDGSRTVREARKLWTKEDWADYKVHKASYEKIDGEPGSRQPRHDFYSHFEQLPLSPEYDTAEKDHHHHHRHSAGDDSMWNPDRIGFATGGLVSGPGTGTSDSIHAPWLSNGEYVIKADTVAQVGVPRLDALNEGRVGFAEGGVVSLPSAYNGAQIMGQAAAESGMIASPFGAPPPATGGFMISAVNQLNSERSAFHSGMMLGNNSPLSASGLIGASATAPVLSGGHYALDVTSDHGTFSVMANEDMMSSLSQSALASKLTRTGITPSWGS